MRPAHAVSSCGQLTSFSTRLPASRMVNAAKSSLTPKKIAHTPTRVTSVNSDRCQERTAHTPRTSSAIPSSNCVHHHGTFSSTSELTMCTMPKTIRYQATKIETMYSVMSGHTNVTIPAITDKIPNTMNSHRQLSTRLATTSSVTPPSMNDAPTRPATA